MANAPAGEGGRVGAAVRLREGDCCGVSDYSQVSTFGLHERPVVMV
jgi:hypothetical protein